MSNKQNNQNRSLLDQQRNQTNQQYSQVNSVNQNAAGGFANNAASTRQSVIDRYSNNNNFLPGGMSPNSQGFFDTSGAASSGGGDFSGAKTGYDEASKTGLINRGDFAPALDSYKGMMGGLGAAQQQALRSRATSQIPSFYDAYKSNLARRQNVQGGYSPGFDAQSAEIGRQAGREGFNASRQAEGDIIDKSNQLAEFGTQGYGNLASDIAGKEQSGRLAGLGGLTNIGGMEQQNNQFNAGQKNALQQQLINLYSQGGQANAQGMANVNAQDVNQYQNSIGNWLQGLGGQSNAALQNLELRSNIQDKHWYDYATQLAGSAGAGFAGLAGMGGRQPRLPSRNMSGAVPQVNAGGF